MDHHQSNSLDSTVGTCESEISIRIESGIESAATVRIRVWNQGGSRLHVQCQLSCGSCVLNNVQAYYGSTATRKVEL